MIVQPGISRVNSMRELLILWLRLIVQCGEWKQRVNSSRELYCCWLLSC